jgi:hypothetical protein
LVVLFNSAKPELYRSLCGDSPERLEDTFEVSEVNICVQVVKVHASRNEDMVRLETRGVVQEALDCALRASYYIPELVLKLGIDSVPLCLVSVNMKTARRLIVTAQNMSKDTKVACLLF